MKLRFLILSILTPALVVGLSISAAAEEEEAPVDYKKLKNPVQYTKSSITRGRVIFRRMCTECHGPDGKAEIDLIADATNLTEPKLWLNGVSEGEIYRSIRSGAGVSMPPYKDQIKNDDDLWHLVNYIRSLWPKDQQPTLVEEPKEGETPDKDGGSDHE